MSYFKLTVSDQYPVWITIEHGKDSISFSHKQLLELKHLIALAEQKVLIELSDSDWFEVSPEYAVRKSL